uniref:Uncharacterized protein n=1 Tax=Anguilla anguilla TaxID=7936 RepID=A0A0E9TLN0_ANGAN
MSIDGNLKRNEDSNENVLHTVKNRVLSPILSCLSGQISWPEDVRV